MLGVKRVTDGLSVDGKRFKHAMNPFECLPDDLIMDSLLPFCDVKSKYQLQLVCHKTKDLTSQLIFTGANLTQLSDLLAQFENPYNLVCEVIRKSAKCAVGRRAQSHVDFLLRKYPIIAEHINITVAQQGFCTYYNLVGGGASMEISETNCNIEIGDFEIIRFVAGLYVDGLDCPLVGGGVLGLFEKLNIPIKNVVPFIEFLLNLLTDGRIGNIPEDFVKKYHRVDWQTFANWTGMIVLAYDDYGDRHDWLNGEIGWMGVEQLFKDK